MNESTHIAREHPARDPPRRRVPLPKLNRPRSGSWGAQELHYYMNNADPTDDLRQGRKSRFLSKLKMQRGADALPGSSSVMTLSSAVPPSDSFSGNNKQKRRPPLPLEMVHPDPTAATHSTPHPSLARYEEKPLPAEPALFAMTPAKNHGNNSKKRTTAIRSIGRFFRALGKNQPLETHDIGINDQPSDSLDEQLSLTINPITAATIPTTPPSQSNHGSTSIFSNPPPLSGKCQDTFASEIPTISEEPEDAFSIKVPSEKPSLSRKHSTLSCLHTKPPSRPALRRSLSLDDLQRDDIPTVQRVRQLILSRSNSHERFRTNNTTDDESDVEMFADTDVLDAHAAHESQIAGDRLSKRLSGGHFGSAGGLILSTLQFPSRQTEDEYEAPNMASTVHTETSESDTVVTPPDNVRKDGIAPVDPYDKEDQEEYNHLAADTAKRIWEQDLAVYTDMEHIAEWIGNGKPLSMAILQYYFLYYDFTNMRLDDAFRKLCGKLHLKAESQQIDRILVEFANRYWDCNPACLFGNSDVVHAVVYSLLLLNTDLHVAQGDHKKMSRSAFVRNTMNAARAQYERTVEENDDEVLREEHRTSSVTFRSMDSHSYDVKRTPSCKSSASNGSLGRFYSNAASSLDMTPAAVIHGNHPTGSKGWQSEVEAILREMYISIRNRQIRHPASTDDAAHDESRHSRRRSLQITGSRVGAFKRSVGTIMWKAARESMIVSEHAELDRATPVSPQSAAPVNTSTSFPRRRSVSSMKSSFSQSSHLTQSNSITTYQAVAPLLHHSELPPSYTSAAPYYKEGLLVRKHLLEKANQKAKHREWKECFLVVDRGEIRMYKLDNNGTSENRKSIVRTSIMISRVNLADALTNNPSAAVGGGDWLANAETIGEIDLKHTLSNALPSGYSRQRPYAFALQQPNGGVYLFQVGSADQVVEWVSTCNYWAARESKEPLTGGVSNMEYGWGSCLDCVQVDENDEVVSWQQNTFPVVTIHEWQPPVPPSVNSAMEEAAQLDILHKHVQKLNEELDKHRDVKRRMELRFSTRSTAGARAMANWENKSQYLLHEIIKYQNYCDAIEKSLALQAKAVEEEQRKKSSGDK